MDHDLPFALPVLTTALTIAGIFVAVHAWISFRAKATVSLSWLLPLFFAGAVLEAALISHRIFIVQDGTVALDTIVRRTGLNLLIWPVIGLTCYQLRMRLAKRPVRVPSADPRALPEPTGATTESLQAAIQRFIAAADGGEVAVIAGTYSADFACIRVADDGGFARLSAEQMLAFWKPRASGPSTGAGPASHTIPTRSTVIHHSEVMGNQGLALITRVKDFGSGWEPVFYTLLWRHENSEWRFVRELVHQRTVPRRL
jgi:hypothetical protein